jgi:hypothetical protein
MMKTITRTCLIAVIALQWLTGSGQVSKKKKTPVTITGNIGVTYEGYGLHLQPPGSGIYTSRKPWNQVRFIFTPTLQAGKFSLPINFNFAAMANSIAGPYAGLKTQSVVQFFTNPANNFGLNPKYKWAELQLGTQYLKYSDLSTGDLGIFGAGFDLRPKSWRLKFFTGTSQQGINYAALPLPGVTGAYQRNHLMFSIGNEKESKYNFSLNFSKAKDKIRSVVSPPLLVMPQEGVTASIVADVYMNKGWYVKTEAARAYFTKDLAQPESPGFKNSFKPFLTGRTSTGKDWAGNASIGKKSKNFDIAYVTKYIGAGFQTMGYPYLQPDRWDNTISTRINTWKDKMNIVASIGQRVNNLSNTSLKAKQFIGNVNWFIQFSERFNTNISYNNFGFTAASGTNPYGVKNVSNDLSLSAGYNWKNTKRMNLLNFSWNFSKYNERDVNTGITTSNNTHTLMLSYVPTYFNSPVSPDFSVLYFNNTLPAVKTSLITLSAGLSSPLFKKKADLRAQLQYTIGKLNSYSSNKNLLASLNLDYKLTKKLIWNVFLSTNYFRYGNELVIPALDGANYLESNYRTGLLYKF